MGKEEKKLGIVKRKEKLFDPEARIPSKRKKAEPDKRSWEEKRFVCPFCGGFIPSKPKPEGERSLFGFWKWERVEHCPTCQAMEIRNGCPACKQKTWYHSESRIYSHGWNYNCGFRGKKKNG